VTGTTEPDAPTAPEHSRRAVLKGGLAAAAIPLLGGVAAACSSSPRPRSAPPTAAARTTLPAAAARVVDATQFMSAAQLAAWHNELDAIGMRATGSAEHERYIDQLHGRLVAAGVSHVDFEPVSVERWTTTSWSLEIQDGPDAGSVATASYIAYSGSTPPAGVTGDLVVVDTKVAPKAGSLRGKIVVFDVPTSDLTYGTMKLVAYDDYDPSHQLDPQAVYDRPWAGIAALITFLDALGTSGAAGAVGVIDLPAEGAHGSYYPYDGNIRHVPGVFVDAAAGRRLKSLAAGGTAARLTLPATVDRVTTRNIVGVIPGVSDETMILNSHTDGPNAVEDNGPNAIVAMSQYLSRLPRAALPRTMMIVLTTGHFHGGIGQIEFVDAHMETTLPKTACALTLEHLGALEWQKDASGEMKLTGRPELGVVFVPENKAMVDASILALQRARAAPAMVLHPYVANTRSPSGYGWPGEGTQLWTNGRIPTANYITGPTYLLNWGVPTTGKCDIDRMRRETIAFTQMALDLGRVPMRQLRALDLKGL
jgi:hypothetical protein